MFWRSVTLFRNNSKVSFYKIPSRLFQLNFRQKITFLLFQVRHLRDFLTMWFCDRQNFVQNDLYDIWITYYYDARCNLSQCQVVCGDRWVNLSTWSWWNSRFGLSKKLRQNFFILRLPIGIEFSSTMLSGTSVDIESGSWQLRWDVTHRIKILPKFRLKITNSTINFAIHLLCNSYNIQI